MTSSGDVNNQTAINMGQLYPVSKSASNFSSDDQFFLLSPLSYCNGTMDFAQTSYPQDNIPISVFHVCGFSYVSTKCFNILFCVFQHWQLVFNKVSSIFKCSLTFYPMRQIADVCFFFTV